MSLDRVVIFARVVQAGGFSAAARALGIPKSSASRGVRQLEDGLGVRLLQRTTRHLRLTEAGQEYYERVASALAALDEARAVVTETQEAPAGVVRLAAPSDYGSWVLAPLIAHFIAQHPGIRLELSLTNRDVDLVRDGFDLALRVGRLHDSSLIVRTIGSIDRGLFAAESYLERRGTPQVPADLASHDFVVSRVGGSGNRLRLQGPNGVETVHVRGPVVTDELSFVQEAVRLGIGVGLLPTAGCATHLRLVRVLPEYSEPGLVYSLVYPSARYVPQRVALLRDALMEHLATRIHTKERGNKHCDAELQYICGSVNAQRAAAAVNVPAANGALTNGAVTNGANGTHDAPEANGANDANGANGTPRSRRAATRPATARAPRASRNGGR